MQNYLMIDNQGVADYEVFTLLGVTTTRYSSHHNTIGMFGTGIKQAIALFLRNNLNPIVFIDKLKMEFFTQSQNIKGVASESRNYDIVCVRLTGKDINGNQVNRTEKLGFTIDMGELDWKNIGMGLREIISNSIDACNKQNLSLDDNMNISLVKENQVRAKTGRTRFFVKSNIDVLEYYNDLEEHFLIFNNGEKVYDDFISHNHSDKTSIYRRGVKIAEINKKSIFNWNFRNVDLDESRNCKLYDASCKAVQYLAEEASFEDVCHFLQNINKPEDIWESEFPYTHVWIINEKAKERWKNAWESVFGEDAVPSDGVDYIDDRLIKKGYRPIKMPGLVTFLSKTSIKTLGSILSESELKPHNFTPATAAVTACLDKLWAIFEENNLTHEKEKPGVECYTLIMNAGEQRLGYYDPVTKKIYIHEDLSQGYSFNLAQTMLEEIGHYVTGAKDCTRDFQDFFIRCCANLMGFKREE